MTPEGMGMSPPEMAIAIIVCMTPIAGVALWVIKVVLGLQRELDSKATKGTLEAHLKTFSEDQKKVADQTFEKLDKIYSKVGSQDTKVAVLEVSLGQLQSEHSRLRDAHHDLAQTVHKLLNAK